MAEITPGEVLQSQLDRRDPSKVAGTPNPDWDKRHKFVTEVRQKVQSDKAPQDILRDVAGQKVDVTRVGVLAEQAISKTDTAAPGGRTTEEHKRVFDIKNDADLISKFVESGTLPAGSEPALLEVVEAMPGADQLFKDKNGRSLSVVEKYQMMQKFAQDPEFRALVKRLYLERSNPQKALEKLSDAVVKAQREFEDREATEQQKKEDLDTVTTKLTGVRDALDQYDATASGKGTAFDKLQAVDAALRTLKPTPEAYLASQQSVVENYDAKISNLEQQLLNRGISSADRTDLNSQLAQARDDREKVAVKLSKAQGLFQEKRALLQEKARLEQEREKLAQQERDAMRDHRRAQTDRFRAQADFDSAKQLRAEGEKDLVRDLSLESVLGAATAEYIADHWEEHKEAHEQKLQEEKARSDSEAEKKVYDALTRMWYKPEDRSKLGKFFKGDRGYVVDQQLVNDHFATLLSQPPAGGPDALQAYLKDSSGSPISLTPEQWDHVKGRMVQELIERKLESGGMKEGEARLIFHSEWGKVALENAKNENAKFNNELLAGLQGQGLIEGSDFGSIMKFVDRHPYFSGLIMALLMGTIALPAGIAVSTIASGVGAGGLKGLSSVVA